jgi:hypothetical protein
VDMVGNYRVLGIRKAEITIADQMRAIVVAQRTDAHQHNSIPSARKILGATE